VKVQLLLLFAVSVAMQVTVFVPWQKADPVGGVQTTLAPEQLSEGVAEKLTTALHWPGSVFVEMLAGQAGTGFSVSLTTIVKLQLAVCAERSVAVHVTRLVPLAKLAPLAGVQVTDGLGSHGSEAVARNATAREHWPGAVLVTIVAGQVMFGALAATTITVKLQLLKLPRTSVAVSVTVVGPGPITVPGAGLCDSVTLLQLSVATTWFVTFGTTAVHPASGIRV
jgi:hypothetical protein